MKSFILLLLGLTFVSLLMADIDDVCFIRFGYLSPTGSETGTVTGAGFGKRFDDIFTLGLSGDVYYRNFTDDRTVSLHTSAAGNPVEEVQRRADLRTYYVPFQANGQLLIQTTTKIKPILGAGMGYGFMWEHVYIADDLTHHGLKSTKFYSGFNWNVTAGGRYQLRDNLALYGELFYNDGLMKRDMKVTETGITWDQIDMSGVGLRMGIEFPRFY
jgi:opacity protein-like surface antigen